MTSTDSSINKEIRGSVLSTACLTKSFYSDIWSAALITLIKPVYCANNTAQTPPCDSIVTVFDLVTQVLAQ